MNPFKIPKSILNQSTIIFQIERNHALIGSVHGFFCGNDYPHTVQFVENTDIKNGDWLIDTITNQRYYAKDVRPISINQKPVEWMITYETEEEHNSSVSNHSTINIHSVNGNSVIGSQQNVVLNIGSDLSDIERLISNLSQAEQSDAKELLSILKSTESATHPVLVAGHLAKFSDLLKKHTDLFTAVGGWAVQLLIGK